MVAEDNSTEGENESVVYSEFIASNLSSRVCSALVKSSRHDDHDDVVMRHSVKLSPNSAYMANIRVHNTNFSGDPSDVIHFNTTEEIAELTTSGQLVDCAIKNLLFVLLFSYILSCVIFYK